MRHTVETVRLGNGAEGLLIDVPDATVMSFEFQFRAGNRYVRSKDIYETAHIMEHMAFGANAEYATEHDFEAEFTKNGAYHNAYTSDHSMVYMADCADFEWQRIFELQRLSICTPRFNQTELVAEKGNVKSELTGYLNNHARLLWPKIQQVLGEDVLTMSERLATIDAVTLDDIKEHHARTHTADNMRFVIAGKLRGRKATIKRQLEEWPLPRGERFQLPHDTLAGTSPVLIHRKEASNITFGLSIVLGSRLTDPELDAMGCLNHLLTGTMHSRMFGAARKAGLAYGMFSDVGTGLYESSWDFGGQANRETIKDLFGIIVTQLQAVLAGELTVAELEAAQSYALGRHQMGAQTVAQVISFYNARYFNEGVVQQYDRVPEDINQITLERMVEVAREFAHNGTWQLAAVSPGTQAQIDKLGAMLAPVLTTQQEDV